MNIQQMLKTLQDPMGVPFYPVVFQVLMVLTFSLHIIFVNLVIGTIFLSIYGYFKKSNYWKQLASSLMKTTTVSISMAILFGVAPLLFVQVIYDPFWYSSNLISAFWVISFVIILMVAYSFTYVFYLRMKKENPGIVIFGIIAFVLFLLAGAIMHGLNYQLLHPEKWLGWYAEEGRVNTYGSGLHAFQIPRFLHFIIPSFAITGIFMMLYQWYFAGTGTKDSEYLNWVARTGARMAFIVSIIQAVAGLWWLLSLPGEFNFITNSVFLVALLVAIGFLILLYFAQRDPSRFALPTALTGFITVLFMSSVREALRMQYLNQFNYSIYDYKLNIDWGSTVLFLITFVMGIAVVGYLLTIAYKSGREKGEFTPTQSINRWGTIAISLLILWLVVMVGVGLVITVKNYL